MSLSVEQIAAQLSEAQLSVEVQGSTETQIESVAGLFDAGQGDITFVNERRYLKALAGCQASAVLISPEHAASDYVDGYQGTLLICHDVYPAYAWTTQWLYPDTDRVPEAAFKDPSAFIDATADVDPTAVIHPFAVIEAHAVVGAHCVIGPQAVIKHHARLGNNSYLHAQVTLYPHVEVGSDVVIHSGTVIGSDGFGFANQKGRWIKIPQIGRVKIGDHVEIGANCTVDRGTIGTTVIEANVIIDNMVHLAHNVFIGEGTAIAAQVGIAGSTRIGKYCLIGGDAKFNGHIEVVDHARISAGANIVSSVTKQGQYASVVPAVEAGIWRKNMARLTRLDEFIRRLIALEKKLD